MKHTMVALGHALAAVALSAGIAACSMERNDIGMASRCKHGIDRATAKLQRAKASGLDGSANMAKGATLLSAAQVQKQSGEYGNCVEKVDRANKYLGSVR